MNGVSNEDDEMLLKLILDKIGECKNLNKAIGRGLTSGIRIINHGRSRTFIEKLTEIRPIIKAYQNSANPR
jgi:hypothetical protein